MACKEVCCNKEARDRKAAAEQAAFEARKAEFERLYPEPKTTATAVQNLPDVPLARAEFAGLTMEEMDRLAAWADANPKVAG